MTKFRLKALSSVYRDHAEIARQQAMTARHEDDKKSWRTIASHYEALAEIADRRETGGSF